MKTRYLFAFALATLLLVIAACSKDASQALSPVKPAVQPIVEQTVTSHELAKREGVPSAADESEIWQNLLQNVSQLDHFSFHSTEEQVYEGDIAHIDDPQDYRHQASYVYEGQFERAPVRGLIAHQGAYYDDEPYSFQVYLDEASKSTVHLYPESNPYTSDYPEGFNPLQRLETLLTWLSKQQQYATYRSTESSTHIAFTLPNDLFEEQINLLVHATIFNDVRFAAPTEDEVMQDVVQQVVDNRIVLIVDHHGQLTGYEVSYDIAYSNTYGDGVKKEQLQVELTQHNASRIAAKPEIRTGDSAVELLKSAQQQVASWDNVSFHTQIEENTVDPRLDEWYVTLYDGTLYRDPLQAYVRMNLDLKGQPYVHSLYIDQDKGHYFNQYDEENWYHSSMKGIVDPMQRLDQLLDVVLDHRDRLLAIQLVDGTWQFELRLSHDEGIPDFLTLTETAFNAFDYREIDHSVEDRPLFEAAFFMIRLSVDPAGNLDQYFIQYASTPTTHNTPSDEAADQELDHFIMEVSLFAHNEAPPLAIPADIIQRAINIEQ